MGKSKIRITTTNHFVRTAHTYIHTHTQAHASTRKHKSEVFHFLIVLCRVCVSAVDWGLGRVGRSLSCLSVILSLVRKETSV
jgi:uncharacterized membrane protein YbaN (DUF454 family)